MNIKYMRIFLPARMTATAQIDARTIAEAAARALQNTKGVKGPLTVQVQGQGQPAKLVSQSIFHETSRRARNRTQED